MSLKKQDIKIFHNITIGELRLILIDYMENGRRIDCISRLSDDTLQGGSFVASFIVVYSRTEEDGYVEYLKNMTPNEYRRMAEGRFESRYQVAREVLDEFMNSGPLYEDVSEFEGWLEDKKCKEKDIDELISEDWSEDQDIFDTDIPRFPEKKERED